MSAAGDALGDSINNAIIALGTLPVPSQTIWRTIANILVSNSASSRRIGETMWTDEIITLSAADPWFNIRSATQVLSTANFPNGFIDHPTLGMRNQYVTVVDGTSDLSVAAVSGSGTQVTITLANDTYCNTWLAAAAEALLYGWSGLGCLTNAAAIGFLMAGDYPIVSVNTVARTVLVTSTLTGATGTGTVKNYPHRIAGSTTTAQWYQLSEITFMIGGGVLATGLPVRDQMQGHYHRFTLNVGGGAGTSFNPANANQLANTDQPSVFEPITDGINGTPRTGSRTRGPAIAMHAYKYTGGYTL